MASLAKPTFLKVDQLKPGASGANLLVKVLSCQVVVDRTRADGSRIRIGECLVGDDTGCIVLTARNAQIDCMTGESPTIVIRNSKVEMFRGYMRLTVDKWGLIQSAPEPATFKVNDTNNLSQVEYELVNVNEELQ